MPRLLTRSHKKEANGVRGRTSSLKPFLKLNFLKKIITEISLKRLFFLNSLFLFFIAIGVMGYLWWSDYEINLHSILVANAIDRVRFAQQLQIDLSAHRRNLLIAELTNDVKNWQKVFDLSSALHVDSLRLLMTEKTHPRLQNLEVALEAYLNEHSFIKKLRPEKISAIVQSDPAYDRTVKAAEEVARYNSENALETQLLIVDRGQRAMLIGVSLALGVFFFASILFLMLNRLLLYPLDLLSRTISRISQTGFIGETVPILGVTDLKKIENSFNEMITRLKEQDELRHRFIASIAHDIRSPISAMEMSVDLLSDSSEKKSEDRDTLLHILKRQIKSLINLTNDLTDSASIQAGRLHMKPIPLDLSDAVAQCAALFRLKSSHQVKLNMNSKKNLVLADPERLTQVLNNVVGNALKYSPNGGVITINVSSDSTECLVAITDQGVGVPEAELNSIFEPFRRSTRTNEKIPGIGLGLATSLKIIRSFGGMISVQSKIGQGSTFTIRLPIYDPNKQIIGPG